MNEAQRRAQQKYDKDNARVYTLKMNKKTDKDVIERLDTIPNRNGYVKALVRKDIRGGVKMKLKDAKRDTEWCWRIAEVKTRAKTVEGIARAINRNTTLGYTAENVEYGIRDGSIELYADGIIVWGMI